MFVWCVQFIMAGALHSHSHTFNFVLPTCRRMPFEASPSSFVRSICFLFHTTYSCFKFHCRGVASLSHSNNFKFVLHISRHRHRRLCVCVCACACIVCVGFAECMHNLHVANFDFHICRIGFAQHMHKPHVTSVVIFIYVGACHFGIAMHTSFVMYFGSTGNRLDSKAILNSSYSDHSSLCSLHQRHASTASSTRDDIHRDVSFHSSPINPGANRSCIEAQSIGTSTVGRRSSRPSRTCGVRHRIGRM